MDYTKNYINWIYGLTKDQFDVFIKAFLKDYWKVETVSITDGKGDGGIDVKILEGKKKKIPLQLTIDKNVYVKLKRDLEKISKLIENHGYSDSFYFYYSRGAAEEKVIELVDLARQEYSIELKIFDNKQIASYLEKATFFKSREVLRGYLGGFANEENSYFDENQKLYFDYLSHADDSKELKERFIISFILNELYKINGDSISEEDLTIKVQEEFGTQASSKFCSRLFNNLRTNSKIEKSEGDFYKLPDLERRKIKEIIDNSELLERDFASKLQDLIVKYDSKVEIRVLIDKLKALFFSHNRLDIQEISSQIEIEDPSVEINDFQSYVKDSFNADKQYIQFIEDVLRLTSENNFLAKLSAGKLFKELMDNPEFSSYARRTNKEVFIDTPVLIYLLLVMKEPDYDYNDYKFKIAKELLDLINSNNDSAIYNTTQLYVTELAGHFKNAIKLIPIEEQGIFNSLGGSSNEILNLYLSLKNDDIYKESFRKYIESFGISINKAEREDDDEYLKQFLYRLFKDNGVQIDDVPPYNTEWRSKKDYMRVERSLGEVYARTFTERRPRSLKFDSLLFCHLYRLDDLTDPTVLTWDKTFNEFRKEFQPKNPNFRYWHLFTPGKFLDHISLLNFKINGSAISKEVMAMIETEFEIIKGIRKIADTLASIVDLKTARGIQLSTGLADIRDTYIYQINKEQSDKVLSEETQPVDTVLNELISYYSNNKGEFNFTDFIDSLKIDTVVEELLLILKYENDYFITHNKLSGDYKRKYDKLISSNK